MLYVGGMTMVVKTCREHSGICQRVADLSLFGKLAMIIFVIIGMAVVGFLWRGQEKLADNINFSHKEILGKIEQKTQADEKYRDRMTRNVDLLMWKAGIKEKDEAEVKKEGR